MLRTPVQWFVDCDGEDCWASTRNAGSTTVAAARRLAEDLGWLHTSDGRDLCPPCKRKE